VSRGGGAGLLARYKPVTSCGVLVVLRRLQRDDAAGPSGIWVYDPMTGPLPIAARTAPLFTHTAAAAAARSTG